MLLIIVWTPEGQNVGNNQRSKDSLIICLIHINLKDELSMLNGTKVTRKYGLSPSLFKLSIIKRFKQTSNNAQLYFPKFIERKIWIIRNTYKIYLNNYFKKTNNLSE